jgi:predicted nucleic acid-binding protein
VEPNQTSKCHSGGARGPDVVLVDTSVWVDHLRANDRTLADLLEANRVLTHPFVVGELSMGNLRARKLVLETLHRLPQVVAATDVEVLHFIERHALYGRGIGYVDAHLLAGKTLGREIVDARQAARIRGGGVRVGSSHVMFGLNR